jgi:asparagine synthase (glutamine-hydrolysing)
MCGLVALWDRRAASSPDALAARAVAMRDTLVHRGPDDAGVWVDAGAGIALGHRRLAILDLSPAGHQPMASADGRWHVVFNGEIYNFAAVRDALGPRTWRGHSDTEILCAALATWGLEATAERLRGMFAIAAWDAEERALWLLRDRLGKKPLYWWASEGVVLVGSELRALRADPACPTRIDPDALADVVARGHVRQPRTILQGVEQVPPGGWVRLDARREVTRRRWWTPSRDAHLPPPPSYGAALDALEATLGEAVRLRAIADVPVGTLLSGGIDSTLVTALLAEQGGAVRTFTVAVEGEGYDESDAAAAIARRLGTEHHTLPLREHDVLDLVPALPALQDEPFADASLLPTWLVCRLAREHVTVAIGGDGGDESFGGYDHYTRAIRAWNLASAAPDVLRRLAAPLAVGAEALLDAAPPRLVDADRLSRRLGQATARSLAEVYARAMTSTPRPHAFVVGAGPPEVPELPFVPGHPVRRLMALDLVDFLPNDILVKTDRASMATSLELRAPLLDHEVVELASRFPAEWTWADGGGKRALKDLLARRVPRPLWERPKQGFGVPVGAWLRGPLRGWAEDLLAPAALEATGLWRVGPIRHQWDALLAGRPTEYLLWRILQAQAWLVAQPR